MFLLGLPVQHSVTTIEKIKTRPKKEFDVENPLQSCRPWIAQRRRRARSVIPLDDFLGKHAPKELLRDEIQLLLRPKPMLGTYATRRLDRDEVRETGDQALVTYAIDGNVEPVLTLSQLSLHRNYLSGLHPTKPRGRVAGEPMVQQAIEGILGERLAVHMVAHHLVANGGNLPNEYEGKDLVIANTERFILKRKAHGEIVLIERRPNKPGGKFGYVVRAEIDGLVEYQNEQRHLFFIESKGGKLDLSIDHVINDLIAPLKTLYHGEPLHYVLVSHHASRLSVGNRHADELWCRAREQEVRLTSELVDRDVRPHLLNHPVSRDEFRKMTESVLFAYKEYKWLPLNLYTRASVKKNLVTVYRPGSDDVLYALQKTGKDTWREVHADKKGGAKTEE